MTQYYRPALTGTEHYQAAERLLAQAETTPWGGEHQSLLARAQIHATLAAAQAADPVMHIRR